MAGNPLQTFMKITATQSGLPATRSEDMRPLVFDEQDVGFATVDTTLFIEPCDVEATVALFLEIPLAVQDVSP
jgi:hypothetical protein